MPLLTGTFGKINLTSIGTRPATRISFAQRAMRHSLFCTTMNRLGDSRLVELVLMYTCQQHNFLLVVFVHEKKTRNCEDTMKAGVHSKNSLNLRSKK